MSWQYRDPRLEERKREMWKPAYIVKRQTLRQFLFYTFPYAYLLHESFYFQAQRDEQVATSPLHIRNADHLKARIRNTLGLAENMEVELLQPPAMKWEVRPGVFHCPHCERVYNLREARQNRFRCPQDNASLYQLSTVFIHSECGMVREWPTSYGRCAECNGPLRHLHYVRERIQDSEYYCPNHPDQRRRVVLRCPNCEGAHLTPVSARKAYHSICVEALGLPESSTWEATRTLLGLPDNIVLEDIVRWGLEQAAYLRNDDFTEKVSRVSSFEPRMGFELRYAADIPLVQLVCGVRVGARGKILAYVDETGRRYQAYGGIRHVEGLTIVLHQERVARWLEANQLSFEKPLSLHLATCDDRDPVKNAVHLLLHTLCHLFIRHSETQSGVSRTGLKEILFPRALLGAIYTQKDETMGFLRSATETTAITRWVHSILLAPRTCINDPLCWDDKGACHACLILPEVSCAHFNENLSRYALIVPSEKRSHAREVVGIGVGYWDLEPTFR